MVSAVFSDSKPTNLLFLLNAACFAEKQQIPILVFGLIRSGLEPTIYCTRDEHANHYTTDAVDTGTYIYKKWKYT